MRNAARAHPRRKQWSLSKHHSRGSRSCRSCQRQHHGGKKVAPKTTIPKNKQDAVQACHGGATNNEHHGGLNNHSIIYKQCRFLQTRSSNSKRRKRQPPKHQNNEKKKKKKKKTRRGGSNDTKSPHPNKTHPATRQSIQSINRPANTTNQPQPHSAQATKLHDPDAERGMDGPRDGPKQRLRAPTHTRSTQHAKHSTQHAKHSTPDANYTTWTQSQGWTGRATVPMLVWRAHVLLVVLSFGVCVGDGGEERRKGKKKKKKFKNYNWNERRAVGSSGGITRT
ncbi:hypothetical protein IWX46DRAFT_165723 [Phyllosticta citricarpa]|uniref:Uncharacterized protein n=1 Tax=Phyllosticta citricarpa TaxID=55181 RepID=A0ABR1M610_9PEZI